MCEGGSCGEGSTTWTFQPGADISHNLALVSVLYFSERPEMISHDEEPKKAKKQKEIRKDKQRMKTKLIKTTMSFLVFACALVSLVTAMAQGTSAAISLDIDFE